MKEKTFKFYKLRTQELLEKLQHYADQVKQAPDPLTLIRAKKEFKAAEELLKIMRGKLDAYGTGAIFMVTGELYVKVVGDSFLRQKFKIYLNCSSIDDAQDLFFSQVCMNYKINTESVKFITIKLKSVILTN